MTILGSNLVELPIHEDPRGCLFAVEQNPLPFDVRRVFLIFDCPESAVRAEHATSCDEAIVALRGSVKVELDNGEERSSVYLDRLDQALCIHAGVWIRLSEFSPDAMILVAASKTYRESSYFQTPNLEILKDLPREIWA